MGAMRRKSRAGFTLAEAMMAVVVLGIAAAGVILPFSSGAVVQAEGVRRTMAAKLAGDLMEQIVRTPFSQVVTTFDGYTEPKGAVKDASGTVFSEAAYANFSRRATCVPAYVPQENGDKQANYVLATVRVYYNTREVAVVNRLISR